MGFMYSTSALPALAGSAFLAVVLVTLATLVYARYLSAPARPSRLQAVLEVWLVMVAGLGLAYAHWHDGESLTVAMTGLAVLYGLIVAWYWDGRRRS